MQNKRHSFKFHSWAALKSSLHHGHSTSQHQSEPLLCQRVFVSFRSCLFASYKGPGGTVTDNIVKELKETTMMKKMGSTLLSQSCLLSYVFLGIKGSLRLNIDQCCTKFPKAFSTTSGGIIHINFIHKGRNLVSDCSIKLYSLVGIIWPEIYVQVYPNHVQTLKTDISTRTFRWREYHSLCS